MHRLLWTVLTVGILFTGFRACPSQGRAEFKPEYLRVKIRELIPRMSRSLGIRVYEPIPLHVVDRTRLKVSLTKELQGQLMQIQKAFMEPKAETRPVLFPDQAQRIAEKVAGYLLHNLKDFIVVDATLADLGFYHGTTLQGLGW